MDIDELYATLPRPQEPRETGSDEDWLRVAEQVGTRLPIDYRYFINSYGTGQINDFLGVYNPFSSIHGYNLVSQMPAVLSGLRHLRERYPDEFPFPLYFEPGGLLPWGQSDNGDYYCWLTEGSPDKWPVVTVPRHSRIEFFDMPMCLFIARALKGELESGAIPEDFAKEEDSDQPKEAVFTPTGGD